MRILFLYMFPLWGNGSGAWLRALAKELVSRGHDVAILAPEKRKIKGVKHFVVEPPQMGVFVGNPELPNVKMYEKMNGIELGSIYTTYVNAALGAAKTFKPEVVHAFHTCFLPPVARIIKVTYGIRYIVTTHGSDLHYLARDRRLVGLIRDAIAVSRLVTANSTFTRDWFLDMFGHEWSRKTRTIPGGVYVEDFETHDDTLELIDKKYDLKDKPVVLFTGRLTEHKGVEHLIRAARAINGEVLILGDGPERPHLEHLIKKYELKNTRILGYMSPREQSMFRGFYKRADVYVAPSTWNEPLGLVVLESMAAKTPVIVTKQGGVVSLVKDGYNGYLVRARNSQQIADRVNHLLADKALRVKMGKNAYESVIAKYTWQKIAQRFEHYYERYAYSTREYLRLVKKS